ncbi:hypothetical protein E4U47_001143, partial [Claviceps purpurea]
DVKNFDLGPEGALKCYANDMPALIDEEGNEATRPLGLVVARGTLLVVITPVDGSEQIANPFAAPEE